MTGADAAGPASSSPRQHYDRVTAAWRLLLGEEFHYGVFTSEDDDLEAATAELTRLMVDACGLEPGLGVLDVGCGTGAQACLLASELGVHVTGITTSPVGVREAESRAQAEGVADRVAFEERDGMDNGFPAECFDRVWVLESSHLMRRRDRLIAECARVLRSGGRLALCDIVLRRPMPFDEVRSLREPLALLREVFGDARMEPFARYAELAQESGLRVDRQIDLTSATRPTFAHWRANADRHGDQLAELMGETARQRFVAATEVMERLWDGGQLGYGLIAAVKP